jgi:hypothetical protein
MPNVGTGWVDFAGDGADRRHGASGRRCPSLLVLGRKRSVCELLHASAKNDQREKSGMLRFDVRPVGMCSTSWRAGGAPTPARTPRWPAARSRDILTRSVVSGPLFPDFSQIGVEDTRYPNRSATESDGGNYLHLVYPSKALVLLVVWSFLAGFSERLVPSILRDTENSFAKPAPEK